MAATRKTNTNFPSTLWTDITQWKDASVGEKRLLLERFYQRYKRPMLVFLYGFGLTRTDAEDLLHDFMLDHVQGKLFVAADPHRGRFRSLLLRSLKHFAISHVRARNAEKRHPQGGFVGLDDELAGGVTIGDLLTTGQSAEEAYDRVWLATVLMNVLRRLRCEYENKGQALHYQLFERRIILPIIAGTDRPSFNELAQECNIGTDQASNFVITAKRAYQRLLKTEIREYVASDKEVAEEINDFFHFLQQVRQ